MVDRLHRRAATALVLHDETGDVVETPLVLTVIYVEPLAQMRNGGVPMEKASTGIVSLVRDLDLKRVFHTIQALDALLDEARVLLP